MLNWASVRGNIQYKNNLEWGRTHLGSKNQNIILLEKRVKFCLTFLSLDYFHTRIIVFESKSIKMYFDKWKLSKYIFKPLNRSMLASKLANITFWHSKSTKISLSCLQYTHLVYNFMVQLVIYFILADYYSY